MKPALVFLHKWLGVALALLFLVWFLSGVVLYFVPFPALTQTERLAGLPALQLPAGCCLAPDAAASRAGLRWTEARLGLLGDRPVWRVRTSGTTDPNRAARWQVLDARDGTAPPPLAEAQAAAVAAAFAGRAATGTVPLLRDQWTVPQGLDPWRPLVKVAMQGDDGLELYVSAGAAEVVRDTRRAERFWNWVGAVPHWIYPTVLRQSPRAWQQVVVALALPGTLLALSGVVLGVWQLFLNRARWIPYRRFWMRWHHIAGLLAGVATLTWIFSGLLSMNPFGVFSPYGALPAESVRWEGGAAVFRRNPAEALALAAAQGWAPRELEAGRIAGQAWYRLRGPGREALLRADGEGPAALVDAVPDATVRAALAGLRAGDAAAGTPALQRIDAYDDLYYAPRPHDPDSRHGLPLPVWRATWADGVVAYADPASARLLLRADSSGRWQRWLYHGLHSLDIAPLLARPALRDALVLGLSALGTALCITSCAVAWRVLVPRRRRPDRPAPVASAATAGEGGR
ncbi:PepSY domain-containing protein [Xylophilus sp. Leaf220]|uniref:PepSY domain-containing protein n=1 Tax=Xylophilus sp. Leaf220 TaxID=1735686 RepID=UPI0006FBFB90|nr:PepSY domain-containing protein [Xylophilus sp. Leaf220]KQM80066.1 hypothetical protein ASE76_02530 [Xylophilus sp. Leaf220]